ncbi:MAG: hypothetical protein ACYDC2_03670 [Solirubrobacteraceae bacterium]
MSPPGAASEGGTRTLSAPRPVRVRWGEGRPLKVDGEAIEALRESWLVEDRWWEAQPLRRRYWELVGARGRNLVVFHDLNTGRWLRQ